MPTTILIDPVTRIEGHLEVEVTVDMVEGEQRVVEARSAGTMFRAFEVLLNGRDPRDAAPYTQRICGVCPVSHALAASLTLDDAFGVTVPDNGRLLRNLVLGANYIQSHVLHFYHLSVLDYVNTTGLLDASPWTPRYVLPDMATGATAQALVSNYLAALAIRRKAHQAGAIFSGKLPCTSSLIVGGCTEQVTAEKIADFRALLTEIRSFVDNAYVPDAYTLAGLFPTYYDIGTGNGNVMSFGVFDLDGSGSDQLLASGRYSGGVPGTVDPGEITEHVTYSWYTPESGGMSPAQGVTEPDADKAGAYSWLKAPRYAGQPYELGPLARMWINGEYDRGMGAMDRTVARALETKKIADAMDGWLDELTPGASAYQPSEIPVQASGAGLIEAPRGALGHWMDIQDSVISRYQVVTPTNWNSSPRDDADIPGPIELALVGTPVSDVTQPVEVLRVVHTFDPCLACAVHMVRPGEKGNGTKILIPPGIG